MDSRLRGNDECVVTNVQVLFGFVSVYSVCSPQVFTGLLQFASSLIAPSHSHSRIAR